MVTQWTNANFDTLGWHDCHVHGLRLGELNREWGACELELDMDYILEWLPEGDRGFKFRIAPATLVFHRAARLRILIDYAAPGAGMTPFSLAALEREPQIHHGQIYTYRWRLPINWPSGEITFDSPGFTLTLRRETAIHNAQAFSASERAGW